ncbi:hypothetical protein [Aureisphaera sp.]
MIFLAFVLISSTGLMAQSYVTWSTTAHQPSMTGTFPGGTVTVTNTGGAGTDVFLTSPAQNQPNLVATGNQTFHSFGPNNMPPARQLTFTFSTPVMINRLNIADFDLVAGGWDDSLLFNGVAFTSFTNVQCNATTTGATPIGESGSNAEYVHWFDSVAPVTSFTIQFFTINSVTTAHLAYSIRVSLPCQAGKDGPELN